VEGSLSFWLNIRKNAPENEREGTAINPKTIVIVFTIPNISELDFII
jgi:hypothetical protein